MSPTKPGENLPPLSEVIHAARRQRAGPPQDPLSVAYPHVLQLARGMLFREVKGRRRKPILEEFEARVSRIEKALHGCETFGDQLRFLDQVLEHADFAGLDLRKQRSPRGPSDATLLSEYEVIHPRMRTLFGGKPLRDFARLAERVVIEFPHLSPDQVAEAVSDKPSWGAYVVVGASHDLSASRVRDRIGAARRRR